MAISISTHSLPIEPKEGDAKDLFDAISNRASDTDDKEFSIHGQELANPSFFQ